MIKIEQRDREIAVKSFEGSTDSKIIALCKKILDGEADEHPRVQAAAFYKGLFINEV